jgi:putative transposase
MIKYDNYNFYKNILINSHKLPTQINDNFNNIKTDSWFDIQKYTSLTKHNQIKHLNTDVKLQNFEKCIKIKMLLNNNQKLILESWFKAHTDMYNEGVKFIRYNFDICKNDISFDDLIKNFKTNIKHNFYDYYYIRKQLLDKKKEIINNSQVKSINTNTKIYTHILDYAIHQLCSNIKSAKSNLLNGNIKRFRIKYWSHKRPSKTIDIEKQYIKNDQICPHILGYIKYYYNGKNIDLKNINRGVKINYNRITDEYFLLVPEKIETHIINDQKENMISLDPGLRTFMTGVTETGMVKIGNNVNKIICEKIRELNKIKNNENITEKIKRKNEIMINRKICNRIDDLQWKSINYLVKNYKTIYLGNMSAKNIVKNDTSILNNEQKVACLRTKYYSFNTRLEYKCKQKGVTLKVIDESYTSKICSNCCYNNNDLGGSKTYNCYLCNMNIDRDLNGARNIYFKSI